MLRNYFITAFRNFWRNKAFSAINVMGLSIGISAALVIFLIVYHEMSYDKFEPGGDRIYHVTMNVKMHGIDGYTETVQAPLANAVQNEVTGVELTVPVVQFTSDGKAKVSVERNAAAKPVVYKHQENVVFINPQYFTMVPYHWLAGSPATALKEPFTVVLSESRAHLYFPSLALADIVGRQITYAYDVDEQLLPLFSGKATVTVSGIVKDLDEPSSFTAAEFVSYATIRQTHLRSDFRTDEWGDNTPFSQLFIKLSEGTHPSQVQAQLNAILKKYDKPALNTQTPYLLPLKEEHFDSRFMMPGKQMADLSVLYSLLAVAGFLLLLGCINFINLTTANAAGRAREIGIRKTMGSSRKQLVAQFLGETFFITLAATLVSVLLVPLLLYIFSDFIPPGVSFNLFAQPLVIVFLVALTLVVSFISGFYPALILSGYQPVQVLKNQMFTGSNETRHAWIRKSLTVSQFVIAQFFVIATLVVSQQVNYSLQAELGFSKDGIITFDVPYDSVITHYEQLLTAISFIPQVDKASRGYMPPAGQGLMISGMSYPAKPEINEPIQMRTGDSNYLAVYGIKILAGRNVRSNDSLQELLVNESYARLLGFKKPEDAIGNSLLNDGRNLPIVGVMQDFHEMSMRFGIMPLVFKQENGNEFHIKLKPNNAEAHTWQQGIRQIQKAYHQYFPDADFKYAFYDEDLAALYKNEQQTAQLLSWATGLAIFISCLGLLGLVMYTIHTRTKEIGIRKILGASVSSIISVLSAGFIKLVIIAFLLAVPLAWWATHRWLQDYEYRTEISSWLFISAGAFMLLMALLTLSIQTIKAATANPVKSLRTE